MKLLIIFFAIVLSAVAEPSQEPTDLTLLRNTWITSKAIAIKPLDEKYAVSLSAMRDKYTKAGNLEAAIFVDNELKALLGKAPLLPQISNESSPLTKDVIIDIGGMKKQLVGKWMIFDTAQPSAWSGIVTITEDLRYSCEGSFGTSYNTSGKVVINKDKIILGVYEFNASSISKGKLYATLPNGDPRTLARIKQSDRKALK